MADCDDCSTIVMIAAKYQLMSQNTKLIMHNDQCRPVLPAFLITRFMSPRH